jgi:hypothetical protein
MCAVRLQSSVLYWTLLFIPWQFSPDTPIALPFKALNSDVSAVDIARNQYLSLQHPLLERSSQLTLPEVQEFGCDAVSITHLSEQ